VPLYVYALMLHGVIGGADVIVNHEWLARLPQQPDAGPEERLHSAREFLFAGIFLSLAWFEWQGALVWWIAALFLGEVIVSACDVVVEGGTRVLPIPERVLHLFLFMNLGVVWVLVSFVLWDWSALPTGLAQVDYGWASRVLTGFALLALGWGVRDGVCAWRRSRVRVPVG
jgi:hypothetical protein